MTGVIGMLRIILLFCPIVLTYSRSLTLLVLMWHIKHTLPIRLITQEDLHFLPLVALIQKTKAAHSMKYLTISVELILPVRLLGRKHDLMFFVFL